MELMYSGLMRIKTAYKSVSLRVHKDVCMKFKNDKSIIYYSVFRKIAYFANS